MRFHDPSEVPFRGGEYPEIFIVRDAREDTRNVLRTDSDMHCPVCGQEVKLWHRALNSGMAKTAYRLLRLGGERDFVHVKDLPGDNHEISQLAFWDLAQPVSEPRPDGGKKGLWRLTPLGIAFANGEAQVIKKALLFNAHLFGMEGDLISIDDALPFNFRDLWNGE